MALPKLDIQRIKELVVEQNDSEKFFAQLPKGFDVNESANKKLLKKWTEIATEDINMEEAAHREDHNVNVYTFSIHNFFRFAFVEREDGSIDVQQLEFIKNKI